MRELALRRHYLVAQPSDGHISHVTSLNHRHTDLSVLQREIILALLQHHSPDIPIFIAYTQLVQGLVCVDPIRFPNSVSCDAADRLVWFLSDIYVRIRIVRSLVYSLRVASPRRLGPH